MMHPYIEREAAFGRAMMADLTGRQMGHQSPNLPVSGNDGVGRSVVHAGGRNGTQRPILSHDAIWDAALAEVLRAGRVGL